MKRRILVMDDDSSICKISSLLLDRLGFEVMTVPDGEKAIIQYSEAMKEGKPFAAVILDLTVQTGMGGLDTLKKLLGMDPKVVAIMSSGSSVETMVSSYQAHGFKAILPKPFRLQDVTECLTKLNLITP